jgi:hypothetical protein
MYVVSFYGMLDIYFKKYMKFFKGLTKLLQHLTREEDQVVYESIQEPEVPEPQESEEIIEEEETILESTIENPYVNQAREWAIKKIDLLHEADRHRNAKALAAEFDEWINIPEGTEEIDYLCLEDNEWTDEQEVDVRKPNS